MKKKFSEVANIDNGVPKYKRIYSIYKEAIETNTYTPGDSILSINEFSKKFKISRDTVFKAYTLLKKNNLISATPNKGYYIADGKKKILLLLSTFKAYKEVLYHSFMQNLPDNVIVDLQFHHYNVKVFKSFLDANNEKYFKYIVMGFDDKEILTTINKLDPNRLLIIDWEISAKKTTNYLLQDFGSGFYKCLVEALPLFKKYKRIHFVYPEYTYHPWESVVYFKKFCTKYNITHDVITNSKKFKVEKGTAYITVNDRILYDLLDQCKLNSFNLGQDIGVLSYNDTPIKRFTFKGISVASVDFADFGSEAAKFIHSDDPIQTYLPTKLIVRESL